MHQKNERFSPKTKKQLSHSKLLPPAESWRGSIQHWEASVEALTGVEAYINDADDDDRYPDVANAVAATKTI